MFDTMKVCSKCDYRAKNQDRANEYAHEYYAANRETVILKARDYRKTPVIHHLTNLSKIPSTTILLVYTYHNSFTWKNMDVINTFKYLLEQEK